MFSSWTAISLAEFLAPNLVSMFKVLLFPVMIYFWYTVKKSELFEQREAFDHSKRISPGHCHPLMIYFWLMYSGEKWILWTEPETDLKTTKNELRKNNKYLSFSHYHPWSIYEE